MDLEFIIFEIEQLHSDYQNSSRRLSKFLIVSMDERNYFLDNFFANNEEISFQWVSENQDGMVIHCKIKKGEISYWKEEVLGKVDSPETIIIEGENITQEIKDRILSNFETVPDIRNQYEKIIDKFYLTKNRDKVNELCGEDPVFPLHCMSSGFQGVKRVFKIKDKVFFEIEYGTTGEFNGTSVGTLDRKLIPLEKIERILK